MLVTNNLCIKYSGSITFNQSFLIIPHESLSLSCTTFDTFRIFICEYSLKNFFHFKNLRGSRITKMNKLFFFVNLGVEHQTFSSHTCVQLCQTLTPKLSHISHKIHLRNNYNSLCHPLSQFFFI